MFKIFLGSQLLAIGNMIYLSYIHYNLKFGMGEKSLCNINDAFNCDIVNLSTYATLLGQPISLWGAFANLTLLFLGLSAYIEEKENKKHFTKLLSILFAGGIVVVSILFAIISFFVLETYCLFCIFAYILSFISLGSLIAWQASTPTNNKPSVLTEILDFKKYSHLFLPILLIIPITLITHSIVRTNMAGQYLKQLDSLFEEWVDSPILEFQTDGALMHTTALEPKMTLLEFADLQCPACQKASGVLHNFMKSRNDVKFVFMFFPLDSACNESAMRAGNGRSCWLAAATYCANKQNQNKGWSMHDWIFEVFHDIKRSDLDKVANDIGLNHQEFTECLDDNNTLEFIKSQARQGDKANIRGTPSIFINGKYLPSGPSWMMLERIYNSL